MHLRNENKLSKVQKEGLRNEGFFNHVEKRRHMCERQTKRCV